MTKDVYPTRCALTGAPHDRNFDGVSLLPVLLGEGSVDPERTMIWVRREGGPHGGQEYYTIRRGRWKLVQNGPFEPLRLYNLDDDPGEGAHLPEDHEKYRELFAALRDHVLRAAPCRGNAGNLAERQRGTVTSEIDASHPCQEVTARCRLPLSLDNSYNTDLSRLRYCTASATWCSVMSSLSSRSARVRAMRRILSYARALRPRALRARSNSDLLASFSLQ